MYNAVLIGYGYWGPNIARNLNKSSDFVLYGICDNDETKLAKARSLYGDKVRYFTDYNEVLADERVQACAVALRNEIGQRVARAVLKSRRHLFMEKPMAVKLEDALELKRLADAESLIIHVDHILIYHPIIRRIKEIIDSGDLGDLIHFESNRANLGPHIKQDMNAMWDLAVHDLAILDWLCGGQEPQHISCLGEKRYGDQEVLTYLSLKYEGFVAMIKSSWFSPLKERSIIVSGTNKMIVFDDLRESEKLQIYDKGVDFDPEMSLEYGSYEARVRTGDLYIPFIAPEDALLNSLTQFATSITTAVPSPSGPAQAIRVLKILAAADKELER